MRSSKNRSRSKGNRNRSVGNVVNRVFDSSGPEGKVRGTPQQIIDKYNQLARDAQLSNDRVAAENFQQHAEHYLRLLAEAMREQDARNPQMQGGSAVTGMIAPMATAMATRCRHRRNHTRNPRRSRISSIISSRRPRVSPVWSPKRHAHRMRLGLSARSSMSNPMRQPVLSKHPKAPPSPSAAGRGVPKSPVKAHRRRVLTRHRAAMRKKP